MSDTRIELQLSNVTVGIMKRIDSSLSKFLKIDDYVIKINNYSIVINNNSVLDDVKKIIKSVDSRININEKEIKEIKRYVFYLENLDCANCASKIERICRRTINCEQVIADFATLKIIIESTENFDLFDLQMKIQSCAEMVDPRIEVKTKIVQAKDDKEFRINKHQKNRFIVGVSLFLAFFIAKNIIKFACHVEPEWWFYVMIYVGYIPSYCILSWDILKGALKNIKNGRFFDEMFLMALATITALSIGYYDEAIFIIVFYKIGELCQQYAINYSRKSIAGLVDIKVQTATVEINGQKVEMDVDGIVIGDILYVSSGGKIALDGIVIDGNAIVDNQALTGESKPVEVHSGVEVLSGAVCIDGTIKVKVTKNYENSMVGKILNIVENASSLKSKSENFISKFAKYYTPVIVLLAVLIAVFLPLISGKYDLSWETGYKESLRVAMIFLVVSCPCALVISIPLGFFGGIGSASKNGILIKGSNYLEALNESRIVVFDKTGTLTKGNFAVEKIESISDYSREDILRYAAFAEATSNHVIAQSIVKEYGKVVDLSVVVPEQITDKRGIVSKVEGKKITIGRKAFIESMKIKVPSTEEFADSLIVAINDKAAGYIIIVDEIRKETSDVIKELKSLGIKKTIMITGDSEKIAQGVATELGIDEIYADMNPLDKVKTLTKIKVKNVDNKVTFVGDGINDAPVISSADIGIAMGGFGNDATSQIADIVLLNNDLSKLGLAFRIAKKTRKIVIENIVFALFIKFLFLIIAPLNIINNILIYGAIFADVGVSLLAILNSLRAMKVDKITVEERK